MVCPLSSDLALVRQLAGAKSAQLAKLIRLGFPVPDGFCLTTRACAKPKREILTGMVASAIASYDRLTKFVVRCSAPDNESGALETTQYELVSDVSGADQVAESILLCLQSVRSNRSRFCGRLFPPNSNPEIAILVQKFVWGEFSGVAYTANPMTGSEEIVVEARKRGDDPRASAVYAIAQRNGSMRRLREHAPGDEISPDQLRALCTLARRVEHALSSPCEIEWIIEGRHIWIIGARRINAAVLETPHDSWTRANIGEVVPERMTPLSYSAWRFPLDVIFRASFRFFRLPDDDYQFIKNESGQLWYNIGAINHLAGMLGIPTVDLAIGTGSREQRSRSKSSLRPSRMLRHAVGLTTAAIVHSRLPARNARATTKLRALAKKYADLAASAASPRACLDLVVECYAELRNFITVYGDTTSASFSTLALLELAAFHWLPEDFSIIPLLSSNAVEVAGVGEALRQLNTDPYNAELVGRFIERYGHRGWQEVEFMNPTWREIGETLWHTKSISGSQPELKASAPDARLPKALSGWRRVVFSKLTERSNANAVLRENIKHEFCRPIDSIRQLFRKAGSMLAAAGQIRSERDLYFLTIGELDVLVSGARAPEMRRRAVLRRTLWERRLAEQTTEDTSVATRSQVGCWQGLGASGGRVAGPARVLRSPYEISTVRPGDILVAESLDVGWFPLFSTVSGLVTSMGGVLSHPCIVARECGLPAVVGISGITERVQNGCWLIVDGDSGIVEMVPAQQTLSACADSASV
jgi:phosphohistidine swiveling domain-containing protein